MTPEQIARLPYRPCVGIVLVNEQGLIFAGQRFDSEIPAWQMPQGGVEKGENPKDAALRELREETGVSANLVTVEAEIDEWIPYDLPHSLVPNLWKGRYRGQEQRWFLLRFLGRDSDINIATEHAEFSRWAWTRADDLLEKIVPFKRATYQKVLSVFGDRLA